MKVTRYLGLMIKSCISINGADYARGTPYIIIMFSHSKNKGKERRERHGHRSLLKHNDILKSHFSCR